MKIRATKTGKVILVSMAVAIISVTLVTATLLSYFGQVHTTANVRQSVVMDGNNWNVPISHSFEATGGCNYCFEHNITNRGCDGIWLTFNHEGYPDMIGIDVTVNNYAPPNPCECVNLPETPVTLVAVDGVSSWFTMTLSNVPAGYAVSNGAYSGWCVDEYNHMDRNIQHTVSLYTACDPNNPLPDSDWDNVAWLINHKAIGATRAQIQDAIWYFIDGGYTGSDSVVLSMINDAKTNGDGFVPAPGQLVIVVVDASNCVGAPGSAHHHQWTFIEVVMPNCQGVCGTPMQLPFYLNAGETKHICLCYEFDMLIAPGTYDIYSTLVPTPI